MRCKLKSQLSLLSLLVIISSLLLAGCGDKPQTNPPETPDDTQSFEEQVPAPVRDLVLSYLTDEYSWAGNVYFAADEPDAPQDMDLRIDSLTYAGETILYETIGVAYEIEYSTYLSTRSDEDSEEVYGWHQNSPAGYVVLNRSGYDDSWDRVLGISYDMTPGKDIKDTILEVAYGIWDIDVSVSFDGYPQPVGPGSKYIPLNEEASIEILKELEPIYNEGDYWMRLDYKDLSAVCYYNAEEDVYGVNSLETTRSDVATHRGIRIGMSRDEVLSAYPAIYDKQYWGYEGDYLWYCKNEEGFGLALLFWFQEDAVTKILLINMFD